MTQQRTRTRARPHTSEDRTEQKSAGAKTANAAVTEHRPVSDTSLSIAGESIIARVRIMDGVTLNMGDYNSFRRDVGLELDVNLGAPGEDPSELTDEQQSKLDAAYDRAAVWVEERMNTVIEDAEAYFKAD